LLANPVRRANLRKIQTLLGVAPERCPSPRDPVVVNRPIFICQHCGAPMFIEILTRTVSIRAPPKAAHSRAGYCPLQLNRRLCVNAIE
jgi:hypothetical protein